MKCPNCGGKGKYKNGFGKVGSCYYCLGIGKVNDKGERNMTNEEWFDGLSTEEKAETIANATYSSAMMGAEITALPKEDEVRKWKMWLKAPHDWNLWLKKLHGGDGE